MPLHPEQKQLGMDFEARCDDGYATCLAAMPLMFALARVPVIALVMALVDDLALDLYWHVLVQAGQWENRLARHLHTKRQ